MQFFRRDSTLNSPQRLLYGSKNGKLFLPLDLCIMVVSGDTEQLQLPQQQGQHNGDPVDVVGGGNLGRVERYDWPPTNAFRVFPCTIVEPDGVDPNAVPPADAIRPPLHINDIVEIEHIDNNLNRVRTGILGTLREIEVSRIYPTLAHRAIVHRIDFNTNLSPVSHGSRIVLQNSGQLIGMLFATQNQGPNHCDAFVFPADMI